MSGNGFKSWGGLALLLILLALSGAKAHARFESVREVPVAPLAITERSGEVGTEFHYLSETDKSGGDSITFSNRAFEEYILYRLKGYVYHPRFIDFETRVKLALLQQQVDSSGAISDEFRGGHSNSTLFGYALYVNLFKEHPLSANLYATRDRDAVLELFTDRLMVETQEEGGGLHWKKGPFPMDLSYNQSRFKEFGFDSFSNSSVKNLDYVIRNSVSNWMQTELRYHFQDYTQDFRSETEDFDIRRHTHLRSNDLNLQNTIYFNPDRRTYLSSNIRWYDQTGTQDFSNFQVNERLNLQHAPNFRTYYLFNYLKTKVHSETVTNYRGEAGLDHRLFESLEEHLDVHWRESKFEGAKETIWGPTGRLAYRKRTPIGLLSTSYARTLDRVERTGNTGSRPIVDEIVTFQRGDKEFLAETGVIDSSIFVTDVTGTVEYDEGLDYEIIHQGSRTALRLLSGRIADGQTVFVDYETEFTTDISFTNDDQNFNAGFDFEKYLTGLSLYYNWHKLDARDAPENDVTILTFTDQLAGMTWRWRWFTWREEYTVYDSNFDSYKQLLSQLEGLHDLGRYLKVGWRAGIINTNYSGGDLPPDQDHSKAVFAGALLRGGIAQNGYWQVEAESRRETGLIDEKLFGIIGKLGLRWRQTRLEAGSRFEKRERFDTERDRLGIFVQFAREFGGPPPRRALPQRQR